MLISSYIFGCKCNHQSFGENFAQNNFIAEIEILKTIDIKSNNEDNRFYKADIRILKLYKGKSVSSILIKGKVGEIFGPACEIEVKKGDKFLVYLSTKDGLVMSSCTPKTFLNNKKIDIERNVLDFVINKKIKNTDVFYLSGNYFQKFKNLKPKNRFAVYEIRVNDKSKAKLISVIQNFGTSEDEEVLKIIKREFEFSTGVFQEIKNKDICLILFFDSNHEDLISGFI